MGLIYSALSKLLTALMMSSGSSHLCPASDPHKIEKKGEGEKKNPQMIAKGYNKSSGRGEGGGGQVEG